MTTCSRAGGCARSNYPFLTLKERDNETGLDYFLARYYSSTQGRFTSPDEFSGGPDELYYFVDDASANPTFYADLRNPQSLNKYQYAFNNPLRYVDPDGHCPQCADIIKVGIGLEVAPIPIPAVKIAGVVMIAGAVVYMYRDEIGAGAKAILNRGGQSAMQQDMEDLRMLRQGNKPSNSNSQQGQQAQSNTASPNPNDNDKKPFGSGGTQTTSTTVYNGKGGRIDVENPNPGQRAGQIHYQSGKTKLLYDPNSKSFIGASKSQNKQLMNDPQIQKAIKKGLKILGESQ